MKRLCLFTLMVSVLCQAATAQSLLLKRKAQSKREVVLKEGKRIKCQTASGLYKGRFEIASDSTLNIKGNLIHIDDIELLRKPEWALNLLSGLVIAVASGLTTVGLIASSYFGKEVFHIMAGMGAALVAMDIGLYYWGMRRYRVVQLATNSGQEK